MDGITRWADYPSYKKQLDTELSRAAEGFVRIGYLLKAARDTDILEGSGYSSVTEFAQAEYGLDKTQVSRFIRINDRFAEGGCSDKLESRYQGFGYAKLTLMLQLPDALNEALSPAYSKADIQALKDEVDEERAVTDIERMLENEPEATAALETDLEKVLYQIGEHHPDIYRDIWAAWRQGLTEDDLQDILAPDGQKMYSEAIPGTGRLMLALTAGKDAGAVSLVNIRDGHREKYSWESLCRAFQKILIPGNTAEESWAATYHRQMPVAEADRTGRAKPKVVKASENTHRTNQASQEAPQKTADREDCQDSQIMQETADTAADTKGTSTAAGVQGSRMAAGVQTSLEEDVIPGQMGLENYDGIVPEGQHGALQEDPQRMDWLLRWRTAMESYKVLQSAMRQAGEHPVWHDIKTAYLAADQLAGDIHAAMEARETAGGIDGSYE